MRVALFILLLFITSPSFALTLGDTDGGASCDAGSHQVAVTFTSAESDDFTAISINAAEDGSDGLTFKGAIWADTGSNRAGTRLTLPGSSIDVPDNSDTSCSTNSYVTSTLTTTTITAQQLWIGGRQTNSSGDEINVSFDTGNDGHERTIAATGDPTDPFGTGTFRSARQYSIYATYTVTASSGAGTILNGLTANGVVVN